MSDRDKGPIDHVADLFVFAPLGFVLEARNMWPDFVRSGRKWCGEVGHERWGTVGDRGAVRSWPMRPHVVR